jgi:hypothetical protein
MSTSPMTTPACDLEAVHRRLQRADRVDLADDHARPGRGAPPPPLADVAVADDVGDLAADEHVGGTVDAVRKRVADAVLVVELALGDRVVDVDRREQQLSGCGELVQPVHAGGGLLGDADDLRRHAREALRVAGEARAQRVEHDAVLEESFSDAAGTARRLELDALVHEQVASPPSSRMRLGPSKPSADQSKMRSAAASTPRASRP